MIDVIVGGQYGSEAKGQLAGFISAWHSYNYVISNNGSQAGHTFVDGDYRLVTRHVPIVGVLQHTTEIIIGPAAIIDPQVLLKEIEDNALQHRIHVHPNAAVIRTDDIMAEQASTQNIGSTGKGNGSALAKKILRMGNQLAYLSTDLQPYLIGRNTYNRIIQSSDDMLIEGAQGYSLSLDGPFWPYCTSRNCWVGQAMADAWAHPQQLGKTYMVIRTFPIRVAGPSGGCYPDQHEITWDEIGVTPEITTVTKKVRRVFTFSTLQVVDAVLANRPDFLAISHLDYLDEGAVLPFIHSLSNEIKKAAGYLPKFILGDGPDAENWKFAE